MFVLLDPAVEPHGSAGERQVEQLWGTEDCVLVCEVEHSGAGEVCVFGVQRGVEPVVTFGEVAAGEGAFKFDSRLRNRGSDFLLGVCCGSIGGGGGDVLGRDRVFWLLELRSSLFCFCCFYGSQDIIVSCWRVVELCL